MPAIDRYSVRLAGAPDAPVYVTVSAARPPQEERMTRGRGSIRWTGPAAEPPMVTLADEPLTCVALGTGRALENIEVLKRTGFIS